MQLKSAIQKKIATIFYSIYIILLISLAPNWCVANTNADVVYLKTERLINTKKITSTKQIPKTLNNHPLRSYLEYLVIKNNLNQEPIDDIRNFYNKYQDEPVARKLNYYWIKHLTVREKWEDIITYYQPNNSTSLKCLYTLAQYKTKPESITKEQIEDLWLYGKSRPTECNKLFESWLADKTIDEQLIWQRIYLAIDQNQNGLIKYLGTLLNESDNEKIKLWSRIAYNPTQINNSKLFNKSDKFHKKIIINGLKKIAYQNIDKSLRLFRTLNYKYKFPLEDKYDYYNHIAIKMYVRNHDKVESIINQIPKKYYSDKLYGIAIKNAMKNNDWKLVINRISNLPKDQQKEDIWVYWLARSYSEINKNNLAEKLYTSIANKMNYYGLMACSKLKKLCPIEFTITKPYKSDKNKLLKDPGIKRAMTLYNLKRYDQARIEWNSTVKKLDDKNKFIAATIASELNWHDRSIVTVAIHDKEQQELETQNKSTGEDNDNNMLHLKYPLGYQNTIMSFAKKYKLDPAWIFAISRQESAFVKDAKSRAGALGVMQLMPNTAKHTAKSNKIPYRSKWNLLNETINIKLGSAYLQQMLEENDGNQILATAAYNAGPNQVKKWVNSKPIATDLWIELIPFYETRAYIKKIITNIAIYKSRLGNQNVLIQDIIPSTIHTSVKTN